MPEKFQRHFHSSQSEPQDDVLNSNRNKKIIIVKPHTQTISVNNNCKLNCSHCKGYFLKEMDKEIDYSYESFLISGGCDEKGKIPIDIKLLKKLKSQNKKINVHPGLVNEKTACLIGEYANVVSFDFIMDNNTIQNQYNLKNKTEQDIINSYLLLKKYCRVVPHLMIGFGNEKLGIDKLYKLGESEVCFIILKKYNKIENNLVEPTIEKIEEILKYARPKFKKISLGCMRPLNRKFEIDKIAIKYVDLIVNPHHNLTFEDFDVEYKDECCCL